MARSPRRLRKVYWDARTWRDDVRRNGLLGRVYLDNPDSEPEDNQIRRNGRGMMMAITIAFIRGLFALFVLATVTALAVAEIGGVLINQ